MPRRTDTARHIKDFHYPVIHYRPEKTFNKKNTMLTFLCVLYCLCHLFVCDMISAIS